MLCTLPQRINTQIIFMPGAQALGIEHAFRQTPNAHSLLLTPDNHGELRNNGGIGNRCALAAVAEHIWWGSHICKMFKLACLTKKSV
jgi:hypothetical protein